MAVAIPINWNDGSGDMMTVSMTGSPEGTKEIQVSSNPNNGYQARTQVLTFQTTAGSPTVTKTLTVTQPGKDITVITYNDKAITRNDVAVGYE